MHLLVQEGTSTSPFACRIMLADKLLAKADYDCDREIRTLELLKIRFGDNNMHNCEVGGDAVVSSSISLGSIGKNL